MVLRQKVKGVRWRKKRARFILERVLYDVVVWTIGTGIWGALKNSAGGRKSSQVMVGDGVLFVSYVVTGCRWQHTCCPYIFCLQQSLHDRLCECQKAVAFMSTNGYQFTA